MRRLVGFLFAVGACAAHATCTVSTTGVAFGTYNQLSGSPLTSTGTVSVTCNRTGARDYAYTIALSTGGSGTYQPRRMTGVSTLDYNLYTDATYTTIWGDGTNSTSLVSSTLRVTGQSSTNNHLVYGRVPAGQGAYQGGYSDSLVATLTY